MVDISITDVQDVYAAAEPSFGAAQQDNLIGVAERLTDNVFDERLAATPQIETANSDFAAYLAAHLWELAEGGEAASQSESGGSVNFNHLQTNVQSNLSETRYGRVCLMMMDDAASTGIIRADY